MRLVTVDKGGKVGPLFETASDRVLAALPRRVALAFEASLNGPAQPLDKLASAVVEHLACVERAAAAEEFTDVRTAKRVAGWCRQLLAASGWLRNQEHCGLVQAAVHYFIRRSDAEHDERSPIGFDDDAMVILAVAREVGLAETLRPDIASE